MQLNRLARDTVEKLLAETGHTLSVGDFGHIHTLHVLAERVSHPYKAADIDLVEMPRAVGGVLLHPLTLGAWQWLEQYAWPSLQGSWLVDVAVPYAMSMANQPHLLREDSSPRKLRRSLRAFLRGLNCTASVLMREVDSMLGPQARAESGGEPTKYGPVIALLCKEYGETPEYWAWSASAALVRSLLDAHVQGIEAEMKLAQKAAAQNGQRVNAPPPSKIDAHRRFKRATAALRDRWQKM